MEVKLARLHQSALLQIYLILKDFLPSETVSKLGFKIQKFK